MAAEYRLPYTAQEINRRLDTINETQTKINNVSQIATDAKTQANAAQNAVNDINGNIDSLQNAVNNVNTLASDAKNLAEEAKGKADQASEDINSVNTAISETQAAISTVESSIGEAQTAITNAQSSIQSINGSIESLEGSISNANEVAQQAKTAVETVEGKVNEAKEAANNASTIAGEAKTAAQEANNKANEVSGIIVDVQKDAEEAKNKANEASETATQAKTDTATALQEIASLGGTLETVRSTMEADYAKTTDLTSVQTTLSSQISQNAAQISSTVSSIESINETINDASQQLKDAQDAVEAVQNTANQAITNAQEAQNAANLASQAATSAQSEADKAKTAAETAQGIADTASQELQKAKDDLATVQGRVDATEEDIIAAQLAVEEAQTKAATAIADAETAKNKAEEAQTNANTAVINALAAQETANDAVDKANKAQQDATDAGTLASNAQQIANNAVSVANTAQQTAETASQSATNAQTRANELATLASEAQTKANEADAKATQAASDLATAQQNLINVTSRVDATEEEILAAQEAVEQAQTKADEAKGIADQAQIDANTAKENASKAQETADKAKEDAEKAQQAADKAQEAADEAKELVNSLEVRVAQAETDIIQTSSKIELMATKESVSETLGGYYTKEQADANLTVKANEIASNVSNTYATKEALSTTNGQVTEAYNKAFQAEEDLKTAKQNLTDVTNRVGVTEKDIEDAQKAVEEAQKTADDARDYAEGLFDDIEALSERVTTTETNISQTSEQIELMATKESLQTVSDNFKNYYTKTDADSKFTITPEQITSIVSESNTFATKDELGELSTTVADQATAINQTSNAIELLATKEEVSDVKDTFDNYYTKEQTDSSIVAKAEEISLNVSRTYTTKDEAVKTVQRYYLQNNDTAGIPEKPTAYPPSDIKIGTARFEDYDGSAPLEMTGNYYFVSNYVPTKNELLEINYTNNIGEYTVNIQDNLDCIDTTSVDGMILVKFSNGSGVTKTFIIVICQDVTDDNSNITYKKGIYFIDDGNNKVKYLKYKKTYDELNYTWTGDEPRVSGSVVSDLGFYLVPGLDESYLKNSTMLCSSFEGYSMSFNLLDSTDKYDTYSISLFGTYPMAVVIKEPNTTCTLQYSEEGYEDLTFEETGVWISYFFKAGNGTVITFNKSLISSGYIFEYNGDISSLNEPVGEEGSTRYYKMTDNVLTDVDFINSQTITLFGQGASQTVKVSDIGFKIEEMYPLIILGPPDEDTVADSYIIFVQEDFEEDGVAFTTGTYVIDELVESEEIYIQNMSGLKKPTWEPIEPSYSDNTKNIYYTDCTVYCDDSFVYTDVALSNGNESAKALRERISIAETSITSNAEAIALRATKTEIEETLDGYYTKKDADAKFTVTPDQITSVVSKTYATKTDVSNAVDGINIGGRNLVVQSTITDGKYLNNSSSGLLTNANSCVTDFIPLSSNEQLACTVYQAFSNGANVEKNFILNFYNSAKLFVSNKLNKSTNAPQDRTTWIVDIPEGAVYARASFGKDLKEKVKIEFGNKATDWSPAPEDVNTEIDSVRTIANQTADKFEWIVESGDSSTNFTLTDRTATLVSDYINLNGLVSFNGLNSDTKDKINGIDSNAQTAIANAKAAKEYAEGVNTTANDAKTKAESANSVIANWCYNNDTTYINGGDIYTGTITSKQLNTDAIKSNNYSYSSGNYSTAGTFLNLSNGAFTSKNFAIDSNGNAYFNGSITLGQVSDWSTKESSINSNIGSAKNEAINTAKTNSESYTDGKISALPNVAKTGNYNDLSGKPTIPTSVSDLGLDTSTIIFKGDITQTTKTDSNGIQYVETTVPSSSGSLTYSTYNANDYMVFGRSKGTNTDGNNYVCISKEGLLTARNAVIYGTVYATAGEFTGKVTATSGEIGGCSIVNGKLTVPTANITGALAIGNINGLQNTIDNLNGTIGDLEDVIEGLNRETGNHAGIIAEWCYNNDTTYIDGGNIYTGTITAEQIAANAITTSLLSTDALKSKGYTNIDSNSRFSEIGTFFDLADGSITSKNFAIDSDGSAYFRGNVETTDITALDEYKIHYSNYDIDGNLVDISNFSNPIIRGYYDDILFEEDGLDNSLLYLGDNLNKDDGAKISFSTFIDKQTNDVIDTYVSIDSKYVSIASGGETSVNNLNAISAYFHNDVEFNSNIICNNNIQGTLTGPVKIKGTNTYDSSSDTVENWTSQLISYHYYNSNGTLKEKPNTFGFIQNIASANNVHQVWYGQPDGTMRHRSGNSNGWNGNSGMGEWKTIIDSSNYTSVIDTLTNDSYGVKMHHNNNDNYTFISIGSSSGSGVDDKVYLGTSAFRWKNIYSINGTIQTSDANEKREITDISTQYEEMFMKLRPVTYMWNKHSEEDTAVHDRVHCGLIAQEVNEAAESVGLSSITFAAICRDDLEEPTYDGRTERWGINYSELHGLEIHMIQKMIKRQAEQDEEIALLKQQIKVLQDALIK